MGVSLWFGILTVAVLVIVRSPWYWNCFQRLHVTWRFMGSYKWGRKSPNMGHNYRYPTYNLIIAHEPPSRFKELTQNVTCSFVLLGVMLLPYYIVRHSPNLIVRMV